MYSCSLLTSLFLVSGFTTATTAAPPVTRPARLVAAALAPADPADSHNNNNNMDGGDSDPDEDDDHNDYDDDNGDPISLKSLSPDGQAAADDGRSRPWYLLGLAGNVSVVHARQADFLKYLRQEIRERAFLN